MQIKIRNIYYKKNWKINKIKRKKISSYSEFMIVNNND